MARLCLFGGDVADGGVDPLTIVVALDIGEQVASSVFRVPKKLSIGALSQQLALRLIDWMMAAAVRISR